MTEPFIKRFDDRYTQSREYQFLDVLNQLHAAVPAVFSNDTQLGQIRMAHAGVTLHEWLLALPAAATGQSQALNALHQALSVSRSVARMDVWHFDLAFRNFMVEQTNALASPSVRLIDFSLAISSRFPVQKPLWMRPDAMQQHPALHAAITEDWRQFFRRNQLSEPPSYDGEFDIPMTAYRADWCNDLAVDRITQRWCVIAHSLGLLLIQSTQFSCLSAEMRMQVDARGRSLMHLATESQAELALEDSLQWLSSQFSAPTPRPRAQVTQAAQAPAQSVLKTPRDISTSNNAPPPAPMLSRIRLLMSVVLIGLGYVLTDALYTAHHLHVTAYTAVVVLVTLALSAILLVSMLFSEHRGRLVNRLSQAQGLALLALALEIWTQRVPGAWPAGIAVLGVILLMLRLEVKQGQRAL